MQTGSVSWTKPRAAKLIGFLAVLVALSLLSYYVWLVMSDNLGTFHNTADLADLADLDNDGDLDVILHNVRNEAEFAAFSVTTLWFNQDNGHFAARRLEGVQGESGWDSAAGDVDRDGDVDLIVFPGWYLRLILNQGGDQGGQMVRWTASLLAAVAGYLLWSQTMIPRTSPGCGSTPGTPKTSGVIFSFCAGHRFTPAALTASARQTCASTPSGPSQSSRCTSPTGWRR